MIVSVTRTRWLWFGVSGALMASAIVFLSLGGLRLGTDFTGGSLLQVRFVGETVPLNAEVETVLRDAGFLASRIQTVGESSVVIRTEQLPSEKHNELLAKLTERYPGAAEESYSDVGPTLGRELRQKAILAIILVLFGIILYISWAFRKSSGRLSGWAFGVNAIAALIHDVLITVGAFAMLGLFFGVEVDALFVTAILTVLGFSVHDTIVVFDRIREGLRSSSGERLADVIDRSVRETVIRSINTSLTTLLVLFALYFFGGATIQSFVLALIIGITVGTYSSIFIASPLLLFWRRGQSL